MVKMTDAEAKWNEDDSSQFLTVVVREEDKEFIARVYSYIFLGILFDWIKDDMRSDPKEITEPLAVLIKGSMAEALSRFSR